MGLASALSTALTGLSAAETQIDVIGNNLANSQTVGFKASEAIFATQFLQTRSLGASPTSDNGGTNPRQVGLGAQVSSITPDFSQGTIEISSSSSDLAIQGDGLFMVEGQQGERLYTRNGIFSLNSANELVNSTGQRLLGFGTDDLFRIEQTELQSIQIPLGSEQVAQATQSVSFDGSLTPSGDVASAAEVIESTILGDAAIPRPSGAAVVLDATPVTDVSGVLTTAAGGGTLVAGDYQYRITYTDAMGNEAAPSQSLTVTSGAAGRISLDNLPASPSATYTGINVYRTAVDGSDFFLLGSAAPGGSFVDDGTTPLSATALDDGTLTGNYTYMITYHKSGQTESRPSEMLGPQSVINSRVMLSNFPTPPTPPASGGFPAYDEIRIYRNLANDQNNFYLVDTVAPGDTFIDSRSDAEISDLTDPQNKLLDMDGPTINSGTLLTNVLKRDGFNYQQVFQEGTLTYAGEKGGRALTERDFQVASTTTVQDLIDFIEDASGIQTSQVDSANPIPSSENNIEGETGVLTAGGYIQNGRLRFVSNNGEANALNIDLSAFRLTTTTGTVATPNLAFGTIQEAVGTSAVSDFLVYDTLGVPINMRVSAVLESTTDSETVYRWYADSAGNQPDTGSAISVGTGLIRFDGNGNFLAATNDEVSINRLDVPSATPLQFNLDFTEVSGLATPQASLAATRQDGSPPGVLTSFVVGEDGVVRGVFSNGISRTLAQIRLARFANPAGLDQRGQNLYAQGVNTGLPIEGSPGENGIGSLIAGARELSNTDIGGDLVDLVLASTQYRGNTRVITASQQLLDELLNLRR